MIVDIEIITLIVLSTFGFSCAMFCLLKYLLCEYFDVDKIVIRSRNLIKAMIKAAARYNNRKGE